MTPLHFLGSLMVLIAFTDAVRPSFGQGSHGSTQKQAPKQIPSLELSDEQTLAEMMALSTIVHHDYGLEPHFYHGWNKEVEVGDYRITSLGSGIDHATVYTKDCAGDGACGACAVAFTATDDDMDLMQDLNTSTTSFCGLTRAHGGFVDELRGFTRNDTWGVAMSFLKTRCTTGPTYAVGTSLGGAVASLFAFCANRQVSEGGDLDAPHFDGLPKIALVTFGSPAVTKDEELYSGQPGQCFDGARLAIHTGQYPSTSFVFTVEAIEHTVQLLSIMETNRSAALVTSLNGEVEVLRNLSRSDDSLSKFKMRFARTYMTEIFAETSHFLIEMVGGTFDPSRIYPMITTFFWMSMNFHDPREYLAFEFDAAPALLSDLGFHHANVAYKEIGHPKGAPHTSPGLLDGLSCADPGKTAAPRSDFMHVFWATLGSLVIPKIQEKLSFAMPKILEALSLAMPMMQEALNETTPKIQEALSLALPKIEEAISLAMPKIQDALSDATPKIQEALSDARPIIEKALSDETPKIEEALSVALPKVQEALPLAMPKIQEALSAMPTIQEAFSKIPTIQEALSEMPTLQELLPLAKTKYQEALIAAMPKIQELLPLAMPKIQEVLKTAFPPEWDYSPGFPNHNLCCYLKGLQGVNADCGTNPETKVHYRCDEPTWR